MSVGGVYVALVLCVERKFTPSPDSDLYILNNNIFFFFFFIYTVFLYQISHGDLFSCSTTQKKVALLHSTSTC